MHILLIDDSSSTRSLLRTLINSGQQVRHEISEAASGEEALQKVGSGEANVPDLVIVDINMGGMSGFDLCREFRQKHSKSDVVPYIIIVTANEGVDVINQALESGANDYMPKPVNVKILQVRLRVAERLLQQAQTGTVSVPSSNPTSLSKSGSLAAASAEPIPSITASGRIVLSPVKAPERPDKPATDVDPRQAVIAAGIEAADAPIAILDTAGSAPSFVINYANPSMSAMTQFTVKELVGKSLSEIEAWTPEFVTMIMSFIERGAIVSHVPLWSHTRQAVPVHLSFYPIRTPENQVWQYLVIHHF